MRKIAAAVFVLAVLAGCGSGGGSDEAAPSGAADSTLPADPTDELAPCEEVYADGITTTEEMVDQMCVRTQGDGIEDNYLPGMSVNECDDGTVLLWNDFGWGYVDQPWHAHAEDADELVAPEAERTACEP